MKNKLLFFCLLLSCSSEKETAKANFIEQQVGLIKIIFQGFQKQKKIEVGKGIFYDPTDDAPVVIWDNGRKIPIEPTKANDTIYFRPQSNEVLLLHNYGVMQSIFTIPKNRDILKIGYENQIPYVKILNRPIKEFDTTIDSLIKVRIHKNRSLSNFQLYSDPAFQYKSLNELQQKIFKVQEDKQYYGRESIKDFEAEKLFAQKLYKNGQLSKSSFDLICDRSFFISLMLKSNLGLISDSQTKRILDSVKVTTIKLPYSYLYDFSTSVCYQKFESSSHIVKSNNSILIDYRLVFDKIKKSELFHPKIKSLLLQKYLELIAVDFSKSDFQKYLKLFEQDVKDTLLTNEIRERFFSQLEESNSVITTLALLTNEKKETSFDEIKKVNPGKIIYVDFWASWCAPCRAAMPQSAKLRQDLKDKNVVFVYLSIDKVFEQWKKANEKEGLEAYPNSYLITNAEVNEFIKQQKINSIPRYMIFDKQGKLAYPNAPNVESKGLAELLVKLAK